MNLKLLEETQKQLIKLAENVINLPNEKMCVHTLKLLIGLRLTISAINDYQEDHITSNN